MMKFINQSLPYYPLVFLTAFILASCAQQPFEYPESDVVLAAVEEQPEMWVTAYALNMRSCPNTTCGVVGHLSKDANVKVYAQENGWIRVSDYSDIVCDKTINTSIIQGNKDCTKENGVINNQTAQWVYQEFLSSEAPIQAKNITFDQSLISKSDDYNLYGSVFTQQAIRLIESEKCTKQDFIKMGGWLKSINHKNQPVYFTYCGGWTSENRIYLNAEKNEIF